MAKKSAGILMYRFAGKELEFLLVHPGGPYWAKKDKQAWSIPKGEFDEDEKPLDAALREFQEETGIEAEGEFIELGAVRQSGGKEVHAWAVEGDCDPAAVKSNKFEMEWPPKSGRTQSFPEIDRAGWFKADTAKEKINKGQIEFIDRILKKKDKD